MRTLENIDVAVCTIPVYLCSPETWNASRARIVSKGYVNATAVTPAPAPATNLSQCLMYVVDGIIVDKY